MPQLHTLDFVHKMRRVLVASFSTLLILIELVIFLLITIPLKSNRFLLALGGLIPRQRPIKLVYCC